MAKITPQKVHRRKSLAEKRQDRRGKPLVVVTKRCEIVSFDVGGKLYRFCASLLAKYPSTKLAAMYQQMVNKEKSDWILESSDSESDNNEVVFLEGNLERFQYVLDYMRRRYDIMYLPNTVSKEAFLNDLDSYGFDDVDPSTILVQGEKVTNLEHFEDLLAIERELKASLSKIKKRKFDNLEGNLEGLMERIRKRKLKIENERDA